MRCRCRRRKSAAGAPADVTEQPGAAGRADSLELQQAADRRATRSVSCRLAALIFFAIVASSAISSAASCRRVHPTMSRGRTVASSARACAEDRNCFAPPGTSSNSCWCRRLTSL